MCNQCEHQVHDGRPCGQPITETYRDKVGIFARPSGITRVDIVDHCACGELSP